VHSRDHADSEYILLCGVDDKGAEFIGNKQIHSLSSLTHSQTQRSTLYISKHCKFGSTTCTTKPPINKATDSHCNNLQ